MGSKHGAEVLAVHQEKQEFIRRYRAEYGCLDCGERDPDVLEFDHRDPSTKTLNANRNGRGGRFLRWKDLSWKDLAAELLKCDVVCINCHRSRTAKAEGWRSRIDSWKNQAMARKWLRISEFKVERGCSDCMAKDANILSLLRTGERFSDNRTVNLASLSVGRLEEELQACVVLCANCHRRRTARQQGWNDRITMETDG